jgi:hypothetical protein
MDPVVNRLDSKCSRLQLIGEIEHWRAAAEQLSDLNMVASPEAWTRLEGYVQASLHNRLSAVAASLASEASRLATAAGDAQSASELSAVRRGQLELRRRYLQAETIIEFFGDAINSRTNSQLGEVLRGLDLLATDSMDAVLRPLGYDAPPVLTYLDNGAGASILRAGVRLWDEGSVSPVAAIKITRHNLGYPTALLHETGHQVFHQTRWVPELAQALHATMAPHSAQAADAWRSWASEVAADVHAFVHTGFAPVPALANVVDGPTRRVFAMPFGDPHPFGWIRVMFNVALCRSWFGPGPWDRLEQTWRQRHSPARASNDAVAVARASLPHLSRLVDVCTREPMRAFGGRALCEIVDPRRVSPSALQQFADQSGPALYTSSHLQRRESMRVLAWSALRLGQHPSDPAAGSDLRAWLRRLGSEPSLDRPVINASPDTTTTSTTITTTKENQWPRQPKAA